MVYLYITLIKSIKKYIMKTVLKTDAKQTAINLINNMMAEYFVSANIAKHQVKDNINSLVINTDSYTNADFNLQMFWVDVLYHVATFEPQTEK